MTRHWSERYVGIPWKDRGRDRSGVDCHGLVRLVHAEQFGNAIPSFVEDYPSATDREAVAEIIARHREGWAPVTAPREGDVALFRILGQPSHVGVVAFPGHFLHVREGQSSVVERLTSPSWQQRLEGVYRYTPGAQISVAAAPHPLRTTPIHTAYPAGTRVGAMVADLMEQGGASAEVKTRAHVFVDGRRVEDMDFVPPEGARVEVRVVAQGNGILRQLLMLAIVVAAAFFAPMIAGAIGVGAFGTSLIQLGLVTAGALLVNYIFPVRPEKTPREPRRQNLLTGGQNAVNPYGAIPVVLGRHRFTPPLGAQAYVESNASSSYLRQVLVWGYGPLQVSDLRIGDTRIEAYQEVEIEHLVGEAGENKARFNRLYSKDVSQTNVQVKLECPEVEVTSASRTSNIITVNTDGDHGYSLDWVAQLNTGQRGTITEIVDSNTFKFANTGSNGTISGASSVIASPWTSRVIDAEVERITVTLHFPEGLRFILLKGDGVGKSFAQAFRAFIQVRQLDSSTLTPLTSFGDVNVTMQEQTIILPPAWYNVDDDVALEPVYRWTRTSIDEHGKLIVRHGAYTESPGSGPSGNLLTRLQQDNYGLNVTFDRLPDYGEGEEPLWDFQMYGGDVYAVVDRRTSDVTGGAYSSAAGTVSRRITIAEATIARAQAEVVKIGATGERFSRRKDAFTLNVTFDVPAGKHEVRVRRNTADNAEFSNGGRRRFSECYWQTVTGYSQGKPITPPAPLAMTAMRIRATNQLNQQVEGISGTVVSVLKDWDNTVSPAEWVERPTRNPASIFRGVLQHPANAQAVPDSRIDLDALAEWHEYCRDNSWNYDAVITEQRPLWDLLLDICAAGRASPAIRDGKYTVVIDKPRTTVVQMFTPHNSWGFEATRALPKLPHAFRVQFQNSLRGWQPDERIVYADGYSSSNATLFEGLDLPGVTRPAAVFKHARFHYAQLRLRMETYTLNTDWEHIVCTRGDLVRVNHDVPLWGLASGRIKERTSSTVLELDDPVPMQASTQYTIKIRLADGTFVDRTVASVGTDGLYSSITLTSSVTSLQGAPGNAFAFGELDEEGVDLIVLGIEPLDQKSARITLVDYAPAVYDSDDETVPDFDSQITLPPTLLKPTIQQTPTITEVRSDESVLERVTGGGFRTAVRVAFTDPIDLPDTVRYVQGEISSADDASEWFGFQQHPIGTSSMRWFDVEEGDEHVVRIRYVDGEGRSSAWVQSDTHEIVGKTSEPGAITGLAKAVVDGKIQLSWDAAPEQDVIGYEVRTADTGWGSTGFVWKGNATQVLLDPPAAGVATTYYVRAYDAGRLYSPTSAQVSHTTTAPGPVTSLRAETVDNNVLLFWTNPAVTTLPLRGVEVRKGATWAGATVIGTKDGAFTSVFEQQAGTYTYWVASLDTGGNYGTPASVTALVNEPPDFVLNGEFNSSFDTDSPTNTTLSNAYVELGELILPVDPTRTVEDKFDDNSWATVDAKIAAGYGGAFALPAETSGYYEEDFDYGTILGSSKVTVNYVGEVVTGSPTITVTISVSDDGVTWTDYAGQTSVYAADFQYVRIRFAVSSDGFGLYKLTSVRVILDAKLRNDGGNVSAVSSDASGTVVNFTKEFIDVTSIVLTPAGTASRTAVYDFQDAVTTGTYSVTSNVCTVSATGHGLIVGQNVRLAFASGGGVAGVYTVATVADANTFTVAMVTANTSGNVSTYPQGFRVYLFNSAGTRQSGTVSWAVKGY